MNYIIFSVVALGLSGVYAWIKQNSPNEKALRGILLGLIIAVLSGFAGLRTRYNDTYTYLLSYQRMTDNFSTLFRGEFSISNVYLFNMWGYFIHHYISSNVNVYFFLSSLVFVIPAVLLINKYSSHFFLSMLIFLFGGMYLFSLAGLKQSMATGILLMGFSTLLKKQYIRYYIVCLIAVGFHTYSFVFFILPLLGNDKIFNKWTVVIVVGIMVLGVGLSYFSPLIKRLIELLGKDINEEQLQEGSVNIIRAAVFIVPLILLLFSHKRIDDEGSPEVKVFIKLSILCTMFMILALFGNPILFGRIPQYFYIGPVITLPYIIGKTFLKSEVRSIGAIAGVLYILFGVYSLYKDGAFAIDIFRLIIF